MAASVTNPFPGTHTHTHIHTRARARVRVRVLLPFALFPLRELSSPRLFPVSPLLRSLMTSDRFYALPAFLAFLVLPAARRTHDANASLARRTTKIVSARALLFADVGILRSQRAHPLRSSKTPRVSASFYVGSPSKIPCADRRFRNGRTHYTCLRLRAPVSPRDSPWDKMRSTYYHLTAFCTNYYLYSIS